MKAKFTSLLIGFSILFITSCRTMQSGIDSDFLTQGNWELESINGKPAQEVGFAEGVPTANFSTEYKITGKSGCNNYSGAYNLNTEGGVNISEVISTRKYCPGNGENEYINALGAVNQAKIDKDKLVLLKDVKQVLVFKRITN